jgi:divalent metal cation (Fe/Co/Zn/Cd) transporter
LLSVYWSRRPLDQFHMFGHGRDVAALASAVIIDHLPFIIG